MYVHCIAQRTAVPGDRYCWKLYDIMPNGEAYERFRAFTKTPEFIEKYGVMEPGATGNEDFIKKTFRKKA